MTFNPATQDKADALFEIFSRALSGAAYSESSYKRVYSFGRSGVLRYLSKGLIRFLSARNMGAYSMEKMDIEARQNGTDWPSIGYTMIGLKRLANIREAVRSVISEEIDGDFVECGVWRGGALMMMTVARDYYGPGKRRVWGFDSFQGMPKPNFEDFPDEQRVDLSSDSYLVATTDDVCANFARFGIQMNLVELVAGWFKDTLPGAKVERISVLRLDGDHYESTIQVLENLYDKVTPGGWIIVDDYNSWEACRKAVTYFRARRSIVSKITQIDKHGIYWRK